MVRKDEYYMQRCLELAKNGKGNVAPNPMVGSVIVHNNKIIGEGYHRKYGEAHAEVNAINSVKNKALLSESTLYVNLEPCAHFGKTPPCSNLIVENCIPRVVIGCIDSFSEVAGKGIEMLKNNGVDVTVGILEKESLSLNKRFFTFHNKKRPYIILKWAQTLDGFMDIDRTQPKHTKDYWISSKPSKLWVHQLRSRESAILVGKNTVLNDNPTLTTRLVQGENPVRLVIDFNNEIPTSANIKDNKVSTVIFTNYPQKNTKNLTYVKVENDKETLRCILDYCYQNYLQSVIVEGGKQTLQLFLQHNLWDEAFVLIGKKTFGKGLTAPIISKKQPSIQTFSSDVILHYINE